MSESESGQEKTQEASEKRLADAREKGQIPRSRDLGNAVSLVIGSAGLLVSGGYLAEKLAGLLHESFTFDRHQIFSEKYMVEALVSGMGAGISGMAPLVICLLLASFISALLVGGWAFSTEKLVPDLKKIDPISGIKKMFSLTSLVELVKSAAKFFLVLGVAILVLATLWEKLLILDREPLMTALRHSVDIVAWSFFTMSCSLILIAAIDVPFQLWKFKKDMKMTFQETKDEHKGTEGSPEVKQKIRESQRRMSEARMMNDVPNADVVITNPTHYAVALKYDQASMGAPILVAKGADHVALRIRSMASNHRITIVASPVLARSIFHTTELQQEVPGGLYTAVAQVLAYVFQLRLFRRGKAERPGPLGRVNVPRDLYY